MSLESGARRNTITQPERGRAVAKRTKVRTTMTPGIVVKVEEYELLDLDRQGLIHSREGDKDWQDDTPVKTESGDLAATTPAAAKAAPASKTTDGKAATS